MEVLTIIVAFGLMLYLITLLYVMPSYFRRLNQLIDHLKSAHESVYSELGAPTMSFVDSSMRGTYSIAMFVVRKEYLALNDEQATQLGNAARWRLFYGMLAALVPLGAIVAALFRSIG